MAQAEALAFHRLWMRRYVTGSPYAIILLPPDCLAIYRALSALATRAATSGRSGWVVATPRLMVIDNGPPTVGYVVAAMICRKRLPSRPAPGSAVSGRNSTNSSPP